MRSQHEVMPRQHPPQSPNTTTHAHYPRGLYVGRVHLWRGRLPPGAGKAQVHSQSFLPSSGQPSQRAIKHANGLRGPPVRAEPQHPPQDPHPWGSWPPKTPWNISTQPALDNSPCPLTFFCFRIRTDHRKPTSHEGPHFKVLAPPQAHSPSVHLYPPLLLLCQELQLGTQPQVGLCTSEVSLSPIGPVPKATAWCPRGPGSL